MAKTKITSIPISGNTIRHKEFAVSEGDIYIYKRDDSEGRFARKGGHANLGYSGYFLASIFDGTAWRKFQINALIPYDKRSYSQAGNASIVALEIEKIILTWRGCIATYSTTNKSFSIPLEDKSILSN